MLFWNLKVPGIPHMISFNAEADAYKAENQRLRKKQMADIQLLVNRNVDDPIASMKLELEKMEADYFKAKE